MVKLHNTLSRKIEIFKPIKAGVVKLYTCGPTVYDRVHIGNLRTYVFEDTLRRVLKATGYRVKHVMNITDIDDKTIQRSQEQHPDMGPAEALVKLTKTYELKFLADAQKMDIDLEHSKLARATEHIAEMQNQIRQIPNKYIADDGIYFDLKRYTHYGRLGHLDRSHSHHRIQNDEYDKDHVADFALWKVKKDREPGWAFELDGQALDGRPGWHIECSAMAVKYLGQPFDIHTGGVDLIFPHHENEIAQSRASNDKELANFFVHGEHLLVDGRKMSKSLNNFYALENIEAKGYDPLSFRLLLLQAHYRSQLNFTWRGLEAAQAFLLRLQAWADLVFQPELGHKKVAGSKYQPALDKMIAALSDDLDSPQALAILSELASLAETEGVDTNRQKPFLETVDQLLGLNLSNRRDIDKRQKDLIKLRKAARDKQDWSTSDDYRRQLNKLGIEISDTPHGPVWNRTTTS